MLRLADRSDGKRELRTRVFAKVDIHTLNILDVVSTRPPV